MVCEMCILVPSQLLEPRHEGEAVCPRDLHTLYLDAGFRADASRPRSVRVRAGSPAVHGLSRLLSESIQLRGVAVLCVKPAILPKRDVCDATRVLPDDASVLR